MDMFIIFFEPVVSFQIFLHFGSYYLMFFSVCILFFTFMKSILFPCPPDYLLSNIGLLMAFCLVEIGRIYASNKGNNEDGDFRSFIVSILLAPITCTVNLYFMFWQAYILRLEYILCFIQLIFQCVQFLYCFYCLYLIKRDAFCWY